jgi:PTH2 family peptidyl-tRNA hydrolase
MSEVKQVIIIRKDLDMSIGKLAAQVSHVSMSFILKQIMAQGKHKNNVNMSDDALNWLKTGHTKVCLKIDSEDKLLNLVKKAKEAGLEAHVIIDKGRTEFNGTPTITCAAIGPNKSVEIDKLTKRLRLY